LKRTHKSYQDPVLWAWLELVSPLRVTSGISRLSLQRGTVKVIPLWTDTEPTSLTRKGTKRHPLDLGPCRHCCPVFLGMQLPVLMSLYTGVGSTM